MGDSENFKKSDHKSLPKNSIALNLEIKKNEASKYYNLDISTELNKTISLMNIKDFSPVNQEFFISKIAEFLKENETLAKIQKKSGHDLTLEEFRGLGAIAWGSLMNFHSGFLQTPPLSEGTEVPNDKKSKFASMLPPGFTPLNAGKSSDLNSSMTQCITSEICAGVLRAVNPGFFGNMSTEKISSMPIREIEVHTYKGAGADIGKLSREITVESLRLFGEIAAKRQGFKSAQYDSLALSISNYLQSLDNVQNMQKERERTNDWVEKYSPKNG